MNGEKIGIGRVSTKEQNPQRQIDAFKELGIDDRFIFIDKCTGNGGHMEERKEYQRARAVVRKGDTVYLDALDRLGRNTEEIKQEWRYFTEEVGCYVVVLSMPILDTRPKDGAVDVSKLVQNIVFEIFSWMAQQETEERKRRQRDGIEAAKRAGKYTGRKPVSVDKYEFAKLVADVKAKKRTATSVMKELGLKRNTYYNLVSEFESKTGRFEE